MLSGQILIGQPIPKHCETIWGQKLSREGGRNSRQLLASWVKILALCY